MLNAGLRGLSDGARSVSVELQHWDCVKRHVGRVFVYWPFVAFRTEHPRSYNITHAPSGCYVHHKGTLQESVKLIRALRRVADFEFTVRSGRKARRARKAAAHLLPLLQRIG